jgi:LDH2 family malate/lactate/ureidoglycolate dehydrogenase
VGTRAPFVVDMAATGVARGKIYLARNQHRPMALVPFDGRPSRAILLDVTAV